MNLTQVVLKGLEQGKSVAQIVEENPDRNADSISVIASKLRKQGRIGEPRDPSLVSSRRTHPVTKSDGFSVQLPEHIQRAISIEALCRGLSTTSLTLRLLSIIVKDNMFDAVLDDGVSP